MKITPDSCTEHAVLEKDVTAFLESHFYVTDAATYHEVFSAQMVERLKYQSNLTAQYVRTRADRLAVHHNHCFEYEIKTHVRKDPRYQDMTIEALPMCHHIAKVQLGVSCLYCYRNPHSNNGTDHGFWVSDLPPVACIFIPPKWSSEQIAKFESIFGQYLPEIKIVRLRKHTRGGGDPFIKIEQSVVATLPHWKDLIQEELDKWTTATSPPVFEAPTATGPDWTPQEAPPNPWE